MSVRGEKKARMNNYNESQLLGERKEALTDVKPKVKEAKVVKTNEKLGKALAEYVILKNTGRKKGQMSCRNERD